MKVQQITQQNTKNQQPNFKGVIDTSFQFLATNQAVGANLVDLCCMVMPRTINDGKKRGAAAGAETFRREIAGTLNDSAIGLFGAFAGFFLAHYVNKAFDLDVNRMFAAPENLYILAENKAEQLRENKSQLDYLKQTLNSVKAYRPSDVNSDVNGYVNLSEETIERVAKLLNEALDENNGVSTNEWTKESSKTLRSAIMNIIVGDKGAQSKYILESSDKSIKSETNLKWLLNDIFMLSKTFNKEKVKNAFLEQIRNNAEIKDNAFVKKFGKFMKIRSGAGFAIASAIGLSVQPLNMYLTRLKTGTDGFVGVEGRTKDKSAGFQGLKGLASAGFFSVVLSTLNIKPWKFTPKKFMDKMSFKGKMPTLNQLKGLYGITIISRIFSARDTDELREVLTKDLIGYLSWLVLGDFVNRITAEGLDKKIINYKKGTENSNYWKKIFYATIKTRDEVLIETLSKKGIDVTKEVDGKLVAKKFSELVKELETNPKISNELRRKVKSHLRTLNKAQFAGYLFSGLVLGLGIPNLNIYITNKLDKKRKEKAQQTENVAVSMDKAIKQ